MSMRVWVYFACALASFGLAVYEVVTHKPQYDAHFAYAIAFMALARTEQVAAR